MFKRKDFVKLAKVKNRTAVTLCIPTHRSGMPTWNGQDRLRLKNKITELKNELIDRKWNETRVKKFIQPIQELYNNEDFWYHQSDSLVIFRTPTFFKYFQIPVKVAEMLHMGTRFYLKPFVSLTRGPYRFFVLGLSQNNIQFFECTRYTISEVTVNDLIPMSLSESMEQEAYEKQLQFRGNTGGKIMYHGHGSWKDHKPTEVEKFFRRVDEGLMSMLHDEKAPLLLGGVDYLIPMYKEVNTYNFLLEDRHITGNMENMNTIMIHEKAWEEMADFYAMTKIKALERFETTQHEKRTTSSVEEIVKAAHNGRVSTLFLKNDCNKWGKFNPDNQQVHFYPKALENQSCLLNMAAIQSTLNGGNVYLLNEKEMPVEQETCAILRY